MSFWVKPDVLPVSPAQLIDPAVPVLFVLETGGLADRAALNLVCQSAGLALPSMQLNYGSVSESSSVDILKQRRGILFRRHRLVQPKRLNRLVSARLNENPGELQIVPVAVYWGRAPDKQHSTWSLFFSENWQIGGRTRKFITTLLFGRDTLLAFSEPLSINTLVSSSSDVSNAEVMTRKLSRILRVHFRQRRIASLGPDQSHRRMLVSQVTGDALVKELIQQTAVEESKSVERIRSRADKYAMEIAADVSYPTVRVLHRVMNRLWTRLYDGVELHGIDRLKAVADGKELVYVPCHRSHIDYLLLSYILYINGFSIPHIAAGINLNLPLVGSLLRRGGAFFLRRSFAGNKLYAAVFNAYLKEILQRGHAIEYFVEGGRSRTGRSLQPKGGMLAMTAHAYLQNPETPVVFIPVYFGYERLLEGRSFTGELAGGKKQKESIWGLLRSLKTLREEYGNVYVNFGAPIELNNTLTKHNANWRNEEIDQTKPEWLNPVVSDLGDSIMTNINAAVCITPVSLLAIALLSARHGKLGKSELLDQMQLYQHLFKATAQDTTAVVPDIDFEHAIAHAEKLGFISTSEDALGALVSIKPGMAGPLTYFRNNIQHLVAIHSLVACCFFNRSQRTEQELKQLVNHAHPFLKAEQYLPPASAESALQDALTALASCEMICPTGEGWKRAASGSAQAVSLMRLAEATMPALERYTLAAAVLVQADSNGIATDELAARCEACAERLAATSGRETGDLYDKHLHRSLINTLSETGLATVEDTTIVANEPLFSLIRETRTLIPEQMRHAILHAVDHFV